VDFNSKLLVSDFLLYSDYFIENDLFQYFSQFGQVADAIVMREKATGRGRGFSFVKMVFKDEDEAQQMKQEIIDQNNSP
jgi:RNA recognition motif-containing protein